MEPIREIKRAFPLCAKCNSILAQCYCAAARDPIEALRDYMTAREQLGDLEEHDSECRCDNDGFYTCDLCREHRDISVVARQLMDQWGDSWAVRLWSIREESRLLLASEAKER
jgi:hypothetical protein